MKTDRRSFFQLGIGAAVAGPQVVGDVAKKIADASGGKIGGYGRLAQECTGSEIGADYWHDRIKEATADLLRLETTPRQRHERDWRPVAAQRIDGLRSVSPINKARMMIEEIEDMERAQERTWIQQRIDDAKKRLGIMGAFL